MSELPLDPLFPNLTREELILFCQEYPNLLSQYVEIWSEYDKLIREEMEHKINFSESRDSINATEQIRKINNHN